VSKNIIFRPISRDSQNIAPKPMPAKKYFPEWYKSIPKFEDGKMIIRDKGRANVTMKSCMPFFDTFTTGYIQETWCDIYIDASGDEVEWRFSSQPQIIEYRSTRHRYPKIDGFSDIEFSWRQPWIPQLPSGYSMMYTHPLNRFDLPFLSLTGIIDNDKYYMESEANHPFFIKENFKGIIPAGTPMFQMIPIKRESWKSSFEDHEEDFLYNFSGIQKYFYDGYKKLFWQKKEYN